MNEYEIQKNLSESSLLVIMVNKTFFIILLAVFIFILYNVTVFIFRPKNDKYCLMINKLKIIIIKTLMKISWFFIGMSIIYWLIISKKFKFQSPEVGIKETVTYLIIPILYSYTLWQFENFNFNKCDFNQSNESEVCIDIDKNTLLYWKITLVIIWVLLFILILLYMYYILNNNNCKESVKIVKTRACGESDNNPLNDITVDNNNNNNNNNNISLLNSFKFNDTEDEDIFLKIAEYEKIKKLEKVVASTSTTTPVLVTSTTATATAQPTPANTQPVLVTTTTATTQPTQPVLVTSTTATTQPVLVTTAQPTTSVLVTTAQPITPVLVTNETAQVTTKINPIILSPPARHTKINSKDGLPPEPVTPTNNTQLELSSDPVTTPTNNTQRNTQGDSLEVSPAPVTTPTNNTQRNTQGGSLEASPGIIENNPQTGSIPPSPEKKNNNE
jgi:hypothetical protein